MDNIVHILQSARRCGVFISVDNDQLSLKYQKGQTITPELLAQIKENKIAIINFLSDKKKSERNSTGILTEIPHVSRDSASRPPLSFSQERLWFIDKLEGSIQYHMPTVLRLKGEVNIEALEKSLQSIIERHEVLRTVFLEGTHAYQSVKNSAAWQMTFVDSKPEFRDPATLQRVVEEFIREPFDLSADYMLRAHLLRISEDEYVLVVTIHHIASDGWSLSIIVKEVVELYAAYVEGRDPALASLEIQYIDYASWQRNHLQDEVLSRKLDYWKLKLAETEVLQLPCDYQRPAVWSTSGATKTLTFDKSLSARIRSLCGQQGTTLYMTLLASFNVLLHKYSGQADICVGSPIANRTRKEVEDLIGFFVNTLVLRSNINGETPFSEFLQHVKQNTLEAYEYQDVPFEKVVEAVVKERDLSTNPLFQVMFSLQNTPEVSKLRLGKDVELSGVDFVISTTLFDLFFNITETNDSLRCSVQYSTQLFKEETIIRMMNHFEQLLYSIVSNPDQTIGGLSMLTKSEQHQLLVDFTDTSRPYQVNHSVIQRFEHQVEATPNSIALVFESQQLSYRQLNERANQLAHYLKEAGVTQETFVPICIERGMHMIIGILGVLKAGGVHVPVDPEYPRERITHMFADTRASIVLTSTKSRHKLPATGDLKVVEIDTESQTIGLHSITNLPIQQTPNHLAYIIYTSGSTGTPKGVMVEHGGLVNLLCSMSSDLSFTSRSSILSVTTFSFDIFYLELFMPLINGGKIFLVSREVAMDGYKLSESISHYRPTHLQGTPSTFQLLLESEWNNAESVVMIMGGEAVKETLKDKLTSIGKVFNGYGPTETTIYSSLKELTQNEKVSIGKPIANTKIYILNDQLQLCPPQIAGEIYIGGHGVARGYLNLPELTAEKFIDAAFNNESGQKIYKTGDVGKWLPDGNIAYLRRKDDQVKIRGYRIELGEIETTVLKTGLVNQAVVLVKDNGDTGKSLVGYYVPQWKPIESKETGLYESQVKSWQEIYETEYALNPSGNNEEFDTDIWMDSFTGEQIPVDQMREWLADIVQVIMSQKPANLLEIGCGKGLIYFQLAGKLKKYIGTDFSPASISHIRRTINKVTTKGGVTELRVCAAHEIIQSVPEQVDTVLLNSIVQYFPGQGYLTDVIRKSLSLLGSKGRIIIGDVRDLRLLELFKGRMHLQKLHGTVSIQEFKWALDDEVLNEKELCLSPEYFYGLKVLFPEISHVEIKWKQGSYVNELSLYRYDVIIDVGGTSECLRAKWLPWGQISDVQDVYTQLEQGVDRLAFQSIPNHRLWKEKLLDVALSDKRLTTVGDLVKVLATEDIETAQINKLLNHAKTKGYHCKFLVNDNPLLMDLLIESIPYQGFVDQPGKESAYSTRGLKANFPLFSQISVLLQKDLKSALQQRLPEYMVPTELIPVNRIPLTANGKIDRKFLSTRDNRVSVSTLNYEPASNPLEESLVKIWQELLGGARVGIHDNFFDIGGHSLLAMRLIAAIRRELAVEIPLSHIFDSTIKTLADEIDTIKFRQNLHLYTPESEKDNALRLTEVSTVAQKLETETIEWVDGKGNYLIPIKKNGNKIPFIGVISFKAYRLLANVMPDDQPMYYLPPTQSASVDEIASHYVKELKLLQPKGPYYISGFCAAGAIAYEMAHQLEAQGDDVSALILFEFYSPWATLSTSSLQYKQRRLSYYSRRLRSLGKLGRPRKELFRMVVRKAAKTVQKLFSKRPPSRFMVSPDYHKYKYRPYSGRVILFQAGTPPLEYKEAELMGWANHFTGEVKHITIEGGHLGILRQPAVQKVAEKLSEILSESNHLKVIVPEGKLTV
ncbi:amino acid adenylation domain-containing protein [Flavitalea antarctica]